MSYDSEVAISHLLSFGLSMCKSTRPKHRYIFFLFLLFVCTLISCQYSLKQMRPWLRKLSENLYRTHFSKIMSDEHHQLHSFIPERQSALRCHSARLKDNFLVRSRTTKRQNTFFMNGFPDLDKFLLLVLSFLLTGDSSCFLSFLSTNCFIWCYKHLSRGRINKSINP